MILHDRKNVYFPVTSSAGRINGPVFEYGGFRIGSSGKINVQMKPHSIKVKIFICGGL
jgi:hypothetical protein